MSRYWIVFPFSNWDSEFGHWSFKLLPSISYNKDSESKDENFFINVEWLAWGISFTNLTHKPEKKKGKK
jgi:hypothetical protein